MGINNCVPKKIVIKLSKILVWDPGSEIQDPEKTYSGSRIQESNRHRIPDPESGSATLLTRIWMQRWLPTSHSLSLARHPCPLQIFLFWYPHQKGGRGRAAQGQKCVWGGGGHGISRTEAEIRSVRVERGAWGGTLASLIPFANMTSNVGYLTLLLLLLLLSVRLLLTVLGSSCRGCCRLMAAATSAAKAKSYMQHI